jgi:hypothetical protein
MFVYRIESVNAKTKNVKSHYLMAKSYGEAEKIFFDHHTKVEEIRQILLDSNTNIISR